jgi:hypothetical protein
MVMAQFALLLVLTLLCARMAQQMAAYQNRSVRKWLWAGALTGPMAPLLLSVLPRRSRR